MGESLRLAFLADPTELHTQRWVRFFRARGHVVVVLVRHDRPIPTDDRDPLPIIRIAPPKRRRRPGRWLDQIGSLRDAVRAADPHVLHAHYLTAQGWLAWASAFRPYAITVWGSDIYRDLDDRKARLLGRRALRGAAYVTADSHDLARAAVAAGARPSSVEVIQFGVETMRFRPDAAKEVRARLLRDGQSRVVLSPRTMMPLYRHELVVRALALLPENVVLVMSARGAVPETLGSIRAEADQAGVADRVVIVPEIPHEQMPAFLNASDVVVSIPSADATPVTLLEAMACGRPVVIGDLPSIREWRAGVRQDLIVSDADPTLIASAIRRALDLDPAQRAELADRSRALVKANADHERNMLVVEQRYRAMAKLV